jgi:hypothetical protein
LPHVTDLRHVKEPYNLLWKSQVIGKITGHFSPTSVPRWQRTLMSLGTERLWRWRLELNGTQRAC